MAAFDQLQIRVEGWEVVAARLKALGPKLARKVIRQALRNGAKIINAEAVANVDKDNAPEWQDTGNLKRAIRVRAGKRRRGYITVKSTVGKAWFKGETFYGAFREWGHKIGKRASNEMLGIRSRKRRNEGEKAAAAAANESRAEVRPYPFMEPAYKSHGKAAAQLIEREILAGIEREARSA